MMKKCKNMTRYQRSKHKADYGLIAPVAWRICDVCGADVPVFAYDYQRKRRARVTCSTADGDCSRKLPPINKGKQKGKPGPKKFVPDTGSFSGGETGLRHTYCRQKEGQCRKYTECLDDGYFTLGKKRYSESSGKCYEVPDAASYGLRAINQSYIYELR
jgi:hypothetical protein